jgi:hypothetical protein
MEPDFIEELKRKAEHGDANAQCDLGLRYAKGVESVNFCK